MFPAARPQVLLPALATAVLASASASAQIPYLFDTLWWGFDTGYFPNGNSAHTMAVADLDGDGDVDVVTGRDYHYLPGVSVMLSNGDGTFGPATHYQTANQLTIGEVKLADFDVDGDQDIIATIPGDYFNYNQIGVWRNNGDGTFGNRTAFGTLADGPVGLVIDDFTGDGFLDVVTANRDYAYDGTTVSLLRHNGRTGSLARFNSPVTFEVGPSPTRVASADINGDGWPDLAVGCGRNPSAWAAIMINDQQGGFTQTAMFGVAEYAEPFVGLADLDNDGDPDLLTASYIHGSGSVLYIQRNDGLGNFSAPESYIHYGTDWARGLDFADVNGDGYLDVLTAHPEGRRNESWTVLLSDGAGGFTGVDRYACSQNSHGIRAVDVDGDGDLDVLSLAKFANSLGVHFNQGDGTFPTLPGYPVEGASDELDAGDIDLDGDLDVVTSGFDVRILRNHGDGTFAPQEVYQGIPMNPRDIKLRDLNGDGYLDLLVGPDGRHPPYPFGTAMNNGDGTFAPGTAWYIGACGDCTVDAYDFDNDGDLDVVAAEEQACFGQIDNRIFIIRNTGDGTFDMFLVVEPYTGPRGIEAADLNHDGNLDLVTNSLGFGVGVHLGNGDLTFGETTIISVDAFDYFTLVDLNGDGDLDVVTSKEPAFGTTEINVATGYGDGTFSTGAYYHGSSTLETLTTGIDVDHADVDLDGDEDVIITNYSSNDLSVFLNNGDATLQTQVRYSGGITPQESYVGDFTGDGVPDVASLVSLSPSPGTGVRIVRGTASAGIPGDADGNGVVDFQDLLAVLAAWGPCAECPEDLDDDGQVNFADILVVLANWT